VVVGFVFLVAAAVRSHGGELNQPARVRPEGGIDIRGPDPLVSLAEIGLRDDPVEATHTSLVDELVEQLHELPVVDVRRVFPGRRFVAWRVAGSGVVVGEYAVGVFAALVMIVACGGTR
jgi:hypothetical protein